MGQCPSSRSDLGAEIYAAAEQWPQLRAAVGLEAVDQRVDLRPNEWRKPLAHRSEPEWLGFKRGSLSQTAWISRASDRLWPCWYRRNVLEPRFRSL